VDDLLRDFKGWAPTSVRTLNHAELTFFENVIGIVVIRYRLKFARFITTVESGAVKHCLFHRVQLVNILNWFTTIFTLAVSCKTLTRTTN
jgi:hypothetical protein